MSTFYKESLQEHDIIEELEADLPEDYEIESEDDVDAIENIESSSDSSDDESTTNGVGSSAGKYVTRSGRVYLSEPKKQSKRCFANVIRHAQGVTPEGKTTDIRESFQKFISAEIVDCILRHSNEEAARKGIPSINDHELYAFIGLLILMGVYEDCGISLKDLWSNLFGRGVYQAVMSRTRMYQVLSILRFDDKDTRQERRNADKFAPLREVFEKLNETFPKYFRCGPHHTIDEMLSLFRGRCPFKVFIKEKPGKYGILIRMLTGAIERYVVKMEVYAGKDNRPAAERGSLEIVKRLAQPICNTGYNITTDRFYTSVELADVLYNDFRLTLVGTLKSNRKEIPEELKTTNGRELYSSKFAFTDPSTGKPPVTLVSYITKDKPKKNLLMLSTQHSDAGIERDTQNKKSHINLYYNSTKGGVDTIDQMARAYSTKRGTRRWPLSVFYTLIDIAALNSYTLFMQCVPTYNKGKNNSRKLYLQHLGVELVKPCVELRSQNLQGLHFLVIHAMEDVLGKKLKRNKNQTTREPAKRARCHVCVQDAPDKKSKKNVTKTNIVCGNCGENLCKSHAETQVQCSEGSCSAVLDDDIY